MQFLRLNETYRMIGYSLLSNNDNFVEIGLTGYDVKPRFGAFHCEYLLQNPFFYSGGWVHGKACWLIANSERALFNLTARVET